MGKMIFDKFTKYISNVTHSSEGEIKPFGYRIRKYINERILHMGAQKRMKGKEPFNFDEDPLFKQAEQVALAAYFTIELPDNERLTLIESYCRLCKAKAMRVFSSRTRRIVCTGCGKELAKIVLETHSLMDNKRGVYVQRRR